MCEDKNVLKEERKRAKRMRLKIVGVGNTMASYSDKYLRAPKKKQERRPNPQYNRNTRQTYSQSQRTISESQVETKKPQISMSQIDKDMEKKMKQKKEKDESDESQDEGPINYDFDLLDLSMDGGNNFKKKDKPNANDEPDFL